MVRYCKELINFIDLLLHLVCFIYYTTIVVEIARQMHSGSSFLRVMSKHCIFKAQTLLPLEAVVTPFFLPRMIAS